MPQIPIYIINLDESTDRLQRISNDLSKYDLHYQRFPAIKGVDLDEETINRWCPERHMWWARRDIKLGEIGCFLSHVKLFEEIIARGYERVCVLEDDADIDAELVSWVQDSTPIPNNGDILKLTINGEFSTCSGMPVGEFSGRTMAFMFRRGIHGTYGYIITRQGAQKALEHLAVMKDAVDNAMFEFWNSNLETYHVYPPVVRTGEESIIGSEGRALKKTGQKISKPMMNRLRRRVLDIQNFYKKHRFMIRVFGFSYPMRFIMLSRHHQRQQNIG